MKGSYNFTRAGLRNAEQHGTVPRELADARPDPSPAPPEPPKIPTSVRLPLAVYERLKQVAEQHGIGHTRLMQQYIEAGLAAEVDAEQTMVPLAEVQRAIARLAARSAPAA